MATPTLVIDTNALADRDFTFWLRTYPGRKILPVVAYVEAGVYHRGRGRFHRLRSLVESSGMEVEWMRLAEAERAIETATLAGDFARNARDHLVAAHAAPPGRVLVTENRRDFTFIEGVLTPAEAMRRLG